jgi:oxygen-independent coproporphyrinogen-3 oxidase
LEANPGTFEADKFAAFRRLGINRLSIGVQSFNPRHLKALGRIHDDHEARSAIGIARVNFDNINLDLMYGLPEQTLLEAEADVAAAIEFAPRHLSAYHLTIEPNTYFHRYPPAVPGEALAADMQELIEGLLAEHGYAHYETSAFARPVRSRHNSNYWLFGDYLGIGAGAHSKISFADRGHAADAVEAPREYLIARCGRARAAGRCGWCGRFAVRIHDERAAADTAFRRACSRSAPVCHRHGPASSTKPSGSASLCEPRADITPSCAGSGS